MDFACHTWAFNDLTLTEALGTIARLGFRCVDIGSGTGLNTARAAANPRAAAAEIREDLELYNLRLTDLYLMLPRISLADDARRERELELFQALVPFAVALGTPGITVSPGMAAGDEGAHERTVEALRRMTAAAQAAGLRLSIEPHLDSIAPLPADALRLLDAVPGLMLTLDWAQMVCQDVFHDEIAALLPRARHLQIRQAARAQLQTPLDRGRIDLGRFIADVQASGYGGAICIEYMNTPGWHGALPVEAVRETALLRDALRSVRDAPRKP